MKSRVSDGVAGLLVVSDTTPISELAKVELLWLLPAVFTNIVIPQQVYDEVTAGSHPAARLIQSVAWLMVQPVLDSQAVADLQTETRLGSGECAAIILAEQLKADRLLVDDGAARRVAAGRHLNTLGTGGILLLAKQQGHIDSVREALDRLIYHGTRIGQGLYREIIVAAGEEAEG